MTAPISRATSGARAPSHTPVQPRKIVALSGSPSPLSKTANLVDHVLVQLSTPTTQTRHIRIRDILPSALLFADKTNQVLADAVEAIEAADGVVIATPIFKAAPSGLLKVFLELLPQFALAGKAVLPLGTGGSIAHLLALDYSLRPILHSMGARHVIQSFFLFEKDAQLSESGIEIEPESNSMLTAAIEHFRSSVMNAERTSRLGHPRPHADALAS
jgi:FMN reductase